MLGGEGFLDVDIKCTEYYTLQSGFLLVHCCHSPETVALPFFPACCLPESFPRSLGPSCDCCNSPYPRASFAKECRAKAGKNPENHISLLPVSSQQELIMMMRAMKYFPQIWRRHLFKLVFPIGFSQLYHKQIFSYTVSCQTQDGKIKFLKKIISLFPQRLYSPEYPTWSLECLKMNSFFRWEHWGPERNDLHIIAVWPLGYNSLLGLFPEVWYSKES